ncbi:MAG: alpha-glucosidase/alpha-galactosidase [Candidatus Lokiarchaeota archaeon]|nr:alpha-glucosidase/alpha-galactosidase [Candidatus Lokiarchaeota archaeon]
MKITFIGAGSPAFARKVLTDILAFPALRENTTLCLEDIDQHRLQQIEKYMNKYKEDNISKIKDVEIEATTNQRKALTDARYIICAIQVGGLDAYQLDMDIPKKYGVHQVVGDSLGPGGIFRFLRSAPVYKSILKDIAEVGEYGDPNTGKNDGRGSSPLFLNYTNPMAMNTWYCNEILPDSTIGLCHGVQGTSTLLKLYVGAMLPGEFSFMCAGINHMAWFLKLWYRDPEEDPELKGPWKDAYPIIRKHFKEEPELTKSEKVRINMFKATGYFMTESSGHLAEYLPYYLKREDLIKKYRADSSEGFASLEQSCYLESNKKGAKTLDDQFKSLLKVEKLRFKDTPSAEYASNIINAMETGNLFQFNGNVINKEQGLITNLPKNCCVEVPIHVDYQGLHPQGGIKLPPICQGLCMSNIMVQQAAVKGALNFDKKLIYHAAMLDPNTASVCSPDEIKSMIDEMFKAEKQWLPQF